MWIVYTVCMKYPFPIRLPSNLNLILSQGFRADTQVDFSEALSITTKTHNGVDIVCGTNEQTWGQECVWAFPWDGIVYDSQADLNHAHAQIDTTDPVTGIKYSVIYIHLSSVTNTKAATEDKLIVYKQGDVIGKIGNIGFVNPPPTPACPLCGSHLHLGLGVKNVNETNYTMVDPLLYFDISNPFRKPDAPIPPFKFNNNLWIGLKNYEVLMLQKRLGVVPETSFFGTITLGKVIDYQKAHGITPAVGFVGPITRASLNK